MRFKIDENLPVEVAELLRVVGHDAITVRDQELSGISDRRLAAVCRGETRAIITLDTDFANIQAYPPELIQGSSFWNFGDRTSHTCCRFVPG